MLSYEIKFYLCLSVGTIQLIPNLGINLSFINIFCLQLYYGFVVNAFFFWVNPTIFFIFINTNIFIYIEICFVDLESFLYALYFRNCTKLHQIRYFYRNINQLFKLKTRTSLKNSLSYT